MEQRIAEGVWLCPWQRRRGLSGKCVFAFKKGADDIPVLSSIERLGGIDQLADRVGSCCKDFELQTREVLQRRWARPAARWLLPK